MKPGGEGCRPQGGPAVRLDRPEACVACRSCELACSFHHLGLYQPSRASVAIVRDPDVNVIVRETYVAEKDGHLACDGCVGEAERQCDKYCSIPAVRSAIGRRELALAARASDSAEPAVQTMDET